MNIWVYGLLVALIGMVIVFVGLVLLILIINIQSWIFTRKKGTPKKAAQAAPAVQAAPVAMPAAPAAQADDDDEIAAVLAAAVLMLGQESGGNGLRVRSIRRVGANSRL